MAGPELTEEVGTCNGRWTGGPGPWLCGTGDIDTMGVQTAIREPATSTTPSPACLLGAESAHPSRSTGKERDSESGNDYFGGGWRTLLIHLSDPPPIWVPHP